MINLNFDGIPVLLDPYSRLTGGQGQVLFGHIDGDPNLKVAVKILPDKPSIRKRLELLCEGRFGEIIPHLSAPLRWQPWSEENGLAYLTTYSSGELADRDQPRPFDELLALTARAAALYRLMSTTGLVHCDVSFNNVLVRPDGFIDIIDVDNCIIRGERSLHPEKAGQVIMMAPEIRKYLNTDVTLHPSELSDRFSWAILFNQLLLRRHPLDQIATNAFDRDQLLAHGDWLELQRVETDRQIPHKAVGSQLTECFRKGFSLVPERRASAEEWLSAAEDSLQRLYRHSCGGVFVCDHDRGACPYCHEVYERKSESAQVTLTQLSSGRSAKFSLFEDEPLVIGRANIPFLAQTVSRQQLQICFSAGRLSVENIGRHPAIAHTEINGGTASNLYSQSWTSEAHVRLVFSVRSERMQLTVT